MTSLHTESWARRTGGALSVTERVGILVGMTGSLAGQLLAVLRDPKRRRAQPILALKAPDSSLARFAEEAASEQPAALVGHGYRTWLFGSALAQQAHVQLDAELFYVASLLHDTGLASAVAGQDFTLRSADVVHQTCSRALTDADAESRLADAVVAHASWGMRMESDPLAYFVQAGAMLDLAGTHLWRLRGADVRRVYKDHPAPHAHDAIRELVLREARAVPRGRIALLAALKLDQLISASPTRRYAQLATVSAR
jgi:hypothetical protein